MRKSFGGGVDVDIYVGEWGVNEEDGMTRDSRGWGGSGGGGVTQGVIGSLGSSFTERKSFLASSN